MFKVLNELNFAGKRVLARVDFNVSLKKNGGIRDDFRLRAVIPTIQALQEGGAKSVVLISHLGRPKGPDSNFSLAPVAKAFSEISRQNVNFLPDNIFSETLKDRIEKARGFEIFLLENLRFYPGENENDFEFAKRLSGLGQCFVNDAFAESHRVCASIVGLPKILPSAAGLLLEREVKTLGRLRENPKSPFTVVMAGAKIEDKLPLIKKFLPRVEHLCLGGGLANTMFLARGLNIGRSIASRDLVEDVKALSLHEKKIHLPEDVVVAESKDGEDSRVCKVEEVHDNEWILDIGPKSQKSFASVIEPAETVFWNGPMGLAEVPEFRKGTEAIVRAVAESKGFSVAGGGDSTRYVFELNLQDKIGFISTGGGAMLDFLSGVDLPGVSVLSS